MNPSENTDTVATAVALGRIDESLKAMNDKLDALLADSKTHDNTLSRHEARIAVLESKTSSWKTVVAIISPIVAAAAFVIMILDRLYGATP